MVAASQPLAAAAGLQMLLRGGNAIDAALATAAVLNVVEPMSTGIGGDMFALVWHAREEKLYALNGSGRAPSRLTIDACRQRGAAQQMPLMGWVPVTVPGAVDGWVTLHERFGSMPLSEILARAIDYAEKGFPVSEIVAEDWQDFQPKLDMNPAAARVYLTRDRAPRVGEIHRQPDLGRTLQRIAAGGREAFYRGEIAERIVTHAQATGGFFTREDFARHTSTWEQPISTEYHGTTVYECPPNGQGIVALEALNILEGLDLKEREHNSAEYLHLLVEALKLAFADARAHLADPHAVPVPVARMLDKAYAAKRRALIDKRHAVGQPTTGIPGGGDTVYLAAVDRERNFVSFVNSLYEKFGSGIVVPGTGICLHNRGACFSLDPAHPNALAGGKRPYHTLIPAMAFREGQPWMTFGVMGGLMQPQGHVQVTLNTVDMQFDPQRALDSPRVRVYPDGHVSLESAFEYETRMELQKRGHPVVEGHRREFGGGQIIMQDPHTGALLGGSDPRKDGCAIGY